MAQAPRINASDHPHPKPLGALREPLFRALWIAAIVSYSGTWMQNVGAAWLMTSLTMSPLLVGLVQAASALPVFLVVLPAGALADIVDRRKLLLLTQFWMVAAAGLLGVLTILNHIAPWSLLLLTFVLGLGSVMNDPAWQAITPEVVSHPNLHGAIALNSAGFNVARAFGPALGGLVIAAMGSGFAFLLNAASFFGVIVFLYQWKRIPHEHPHPKERMLEAIRTGLRYVRTSQPMRAVLVRTGAFSIAAIAILALLPVVARPFGSVGFGVLLGCFGAGALLGAAVLPVVRRMLSIDALVAWSTVVFAATTFAVGRANTYTALVLVMLIAGGAWINILASLNVSAQTTAPAWLRARAISMYLLILQGGMAAGSTLWGAVAQHYGIPNSLLLASIVLIVGLLAVPKYRLHARDVPLETVTPGNQL